MTATQPMHLPRARDRAAWLALPEGMKAQILEAGAALSGGGYPSVTATQHMAFSRTGNRVVFQEPYYARRQRLIRACLAECLQWDGGYLDHVIDGIWCICEESSWCVSAHAWKAGPGRETLLLPDVHRPIIDLFAAQTAGVLSWVCYLLEDRLPPVVVERVRDEVRTRILTPFLQRDDFWWMGFHGESLNNWTPWILSNVLASLHIWGARGDARAEEMLNRWLSFIPEDGGIDEGVGYWNMAGGSLLDCLDYLPGSRYGEAKIRNIAAFPLNAHIAGPYYINYADCDARPMLDGERVYTFGKRTENEGLMALGASICEATPSIFPPDTPEFYRTLCRLLNRVEAPARPAPVPDYLPLPNLEVWTRREAGVYFAIKGGHNAESHNHNDVGGIIVFIDGAPAIVDAGNVIYTAKTFSDQRYTLWNTRSENHNVPLVGGVEQAVGREFAAQDVRLARNLAEMDIGPAYAPAAGIRRLLRRVEAGEGFVMTDDIDLAAPLPVTWVFLLRERPAIDKGQARAGALCLTFDPALAAECAEYPVEDPRMAKSYPGTLYRLTLTAAAAERHTQAFRIGKCR